jgi:hypothetical protein
MWYSCSWSICIGCFNGRVLDSLLVPICVGSHGLVFRSMGICIEDLNALNLFYCRAIMASSIVGWLWRVLGLGIVVNNGLQ